jgi:hypothetical protein
MVTFVDIQVWTCLKVIIVKGGKMNSEDCFELFVQFYNRMIEEDRAIVAFMFMQNFLRRMFAARGF